MPSALLSLRRPVNLTYLTYLLCFNLSCGVFLHFYFFRNDDVTMSHHQILVQKLTIRSNFYPRGSNKLIFGENEGLYALDLLWKNGYGVFQLPEVTGV